jgi:hypothetical protein
MLNEANEVYAHNESVKVQIKTNLQEVEIER